MHFVDPKHQLTLRLFPIVFLIGAMFALLSSQACSIGVAPVNCINSSDCGANSICLQGQCVVTQIGDDTGDTSHDEDGSNDDASDASNDEPVGDTRPDLDRGDPDDVADTQDDTEIADDVEVDVPRDIEADAVDWELDPAPGVDQPGTTSCDGGPSGSFPGFPDETVGRLLRIQAQVSDVGEEPGVWYVRNGEDEVRGNIYVSPVNGNFEVVVPTPCGHSLIKLVWDVEPCALVAVFTVDGQYCAPEELEVSLVWRDSDIDLDLHLVRPDGDFSTVDDCNSSTCIAGNLDWGEPGNSVDDPIKDEDVTMGRGPESIYLSQLEEGDYWVLIDHWFGEDTWAAVHILLDGVPYVAEIEVLRFHDVWQGVMLNAWEQEVEVFTTTIDCSDDWVSGCQLPLPQRD